VPEIDRVTQARNINEVDDMARDLIAIMTGVEPDSFDWTYESSSPTACEHTCQRSSGHEAPKPRHAPTQPPNSAPPPPNSRTPDYPSVNSAQFLESPTNAPASSPAAAAPQGNVAEPAELVNSPKGVEGATRLPNPHGSGTVDTASCRSAQRNPAPELRDSTADQMIIATPARCQDSAQVAEQRHGVQRWDGVADRDRGDGARPEQARQ